MKKILFICMGNICRSPSAEGIFTQMVEQARLSDRFEIDSAGTHAYHVGEPPDHRAQDAALRRDIDLSTLRARRVTRQDLEVFDLVLAMDQQNLTHLSAMCPAGHGDKLRLLMDYAPEVGVREVPDPYYGGLDGFERVLDMIELASRNLLESLK